MPSPSHLCCFALMMKWSTLQLAATLEFPSVGACHPHSCHQCRGHVNQLNMHGLIISCRLSAGCLPQYVTINTIVMMSQPEHRSVYAGAFRLYIAGQMASTEMESPVPHGKQVTLVWGIPCGVSIDNQRQGQWPSQLRRRVYKVQEVGQDTPCGPSSA